MGSEAAGLGLLVLVVLVLCYLVPTLASRRARLSSGALQDRYSSRLRVVAKTDRSAPRRVVRDQRAGQVTVVTSKHRVGRGKEAGGIVQRPDSAQPARPEPATAPRSGVTLPAGVATGGGAQAPSRPTAPRSRPTATDVSKAAHARALLVSRRRAAARRRAVLATALGVLAVAGVLVAATGALTSAPWAWALAVVPAFLLALVLIAGARAAAGNRRLDAARRAGEPRTAGARPTQRPTRPEDTSWMDEVTAPEAPADAPSEEPDRQDEEWTPRPVPRPTYTMKPRAPRMVPSALVIEELRAEGAIPATPARPHEPERREQAPPTPEPSRENSETAATASAAVVQQADPATAQTTLDRLTSGGLGAGLDRALAKRRAVGQ